MLYAPCAMLFSNRLHAPLTDGLMLGMLPHADIIVPAPFAFLPLRPEDLYRCFFHIFSPEMERDRGYDKDRFQFLFKRLEKLIHLFRKMETDLSIQREPNLFLL